ncbi:MAG: anti-sigma factor [Rhodobacteraceae bacterium]|nr:anti-sigma factor [Paracoccaceae bacterium]
MNEFSEQLSAYLDGELDEKAAEAVEARLADDPQAQAQLDALMQADAFAREEFSTQLDEPVPFALAQQIKTTQIQTQPPRSRPVWGALAAGLVLVAIGGFGGYAYKGAVTPIQTAGWLADIADYHAVYASEVRHLVEVGADESDHIETWLGNTVGARFDIPDLTSFGLTFQGGRLLVANAKPVAQLMYLDADGAVVALCLQRSAKSPQGAPEFKEQQINGFDFISWSANGADYVVIGPMDQENLNAVAERAALEV